MRKGKTKTKVRVDLTGQQFGRLIVVRQSLDHVYQGGGKVAAWECLCECGETAYVTGSSLSRGHTKSCGCYRSEVSSKRVSAGGHSRTKLNKLYKSMLHRCNNMNDPAYKYYGGRGIIVCDEWRYDFMAFYTWAHENGYKDGLTLDRIDNDGNYCPENCRWATWHEQAANKSNSNSTVGVGYNKIKGKWEARLQINGKLVLHKMFVTYQEAVVARKEAEIKYDVASM